MDLTNLAYRNEKNQLDKEKKNHERKINFHLKGLGNNKNKNIINNATIIDIKNDTLKPKRKSKHSTYM